MSQGRDQPRMPEFVFSSFEGSETSAPGPARRNLLIKKINEDVLEAGGSGVLPPLLWGTGGSKVSALRPRS